MAAGDAIGAIYSVTGKTYQNYQPAAGVEICITNFAYQDAANSYIYLYDGANEAAILKPTSTVSNNASPVKVIISNSVYIRFYNDAVGAKTLGFSGIQLK